MRLNENTIIIGRSVLLVPYKKCHVEKYHEWMKSSELLEKTASEPLSLHEEYEMQEKWWKDDDKCTFIVLNKSIFLSDESDDREINSMIGDVNLFFNNPDDSSEAELELMIAEKSSRGLGCGKECAKLMMFYGSKFLNVLKYSVKIGASNVESISLFKKLGFELKSHSEIFQESTFGLLCKADIFIKDIFNDVAGYFKTSCYEKGLQKVCSE